MVRGPARSASKRVPRSIDALLARRAAARILTAQQVETFELTEENVEKVLDEVSRALASLAASEEQRAQRPPFAGVRGVGCSSPPASPEDSTLGVLAT